ncbi:MAG TPA: ABC transporter permease [Desulfomonilaceae bacterium]|nr:ABC transporter permease [Desulfomonilaceae bacterium]
MNITEAVNISLSSIRANKLRSFLTLLGLIIGVMTLILVMTIVQGANLYVEEKIADLGTNVFQVSKTPLVVTDFQEYARAQRYKDLNLEDLQAIREQCHGCQAVGAQVSTVTTVKYGNESGEDTSIRGVTSNMAEISTVNVEDGRYLTAYEESTASPVCVVGRDVIDHLFPQVGAIDRWIRIANQPYRIIGVAERIGNVLGQSQDNFVLIPLSCFFKDFGSHRSITLQVKCSSSDKIEPAQAQVRMILRSRRHVPFNSPDNFYMATSDTFLSLWASISSAFFMVFIMISSIASIVGGIVIMNIMLVSVTERTKEIGIRRAVGAREIDILWQFLVEALVQCVVGGLLGILLGFGLAIVVRQFTPFPASVRAWVAVTGFLLSALIGIFFGIYPARKASKLDPIDALRRE